MSASLFSTVIAAVLHVSGVSGFVGAGVVGFAVGREVGDGVNAVGSIVVGFADGFCVGLSLANAVGFADGTKVVGAAVMGASVVGAAVIGAGVDGAAVIGAGVDGADVIGAGVDGADVIGVIGAGVVGMFVDGMAVEGPMVVDEREQGSSHESELSLSLSLPMLSPLVSPLSLPLLLPLRLGSQPTLSLSDETESLRLVTASLESSSSSRRETGRSASWASASDRDVESTDKATINANDFMLRCVASALF